MEETSREQAGLPVVGAVIADKYRVEGVLGHGGMGAVYAARNLTTGKRVALKWLLPEHARSTMRERLLREARIAATITHPNVVDIYDAGEHEGGLFLVMEYLRGRPLSELLTARGQLNPEEIAVLLLPAMSGVHAAHRAGVIHRDLKPDNIILSETSGQIVPKVVDFGASKLIGGAISSTSLTRAGMLVGTPHYMAVEQLDGSEKVDARTDVYAFGVLLYQALTGKLPFDAESLGALIVSIATRDPLPPRVLRPELPCELEAITLRALARNREERFQTLEEFALALGPFASPHRVDRSTHGLEPCSARSCPAPGMSAPSSPTMELAPFAPDLAASHGQRSRSFRLRQAAALLCGAAVVLMPFLVDDLFAHSHATPAARRDPVAHGQPAGALEDRRPATAHASFAPMLTWALDVERSTRASGGACASSSPALKAAEPRREEDAVTAASAGPASSARSDGRHRQERSYRRQARAAGASEAGRGAVVSSRVPGRRSEGLRFDEFPDHPLIARGLEEFEHANWQDARVLFRRAHDLEPSARTLRGIGIVSYEMGDYGQAVLALAAALADTRKPLTEPLRRECELLVARARAELVAQPISAASSEPPPFPGDAESAPAAASEHWARARSKRSEVCPHQRCR